MKWRFCVILVLFIELQASAHPMPGSVVDLFVLEKSIVGEARIPFLELQNALYAQNDFSDLHKPVFYAYFKAHIQAVTDKKKWVTNVDSVRLVESQDPIVGKYQEVIVYFEMIPSNKENLRHFTFNYDVVLHQVVNHKVLVNVQQDWYAGIEEQSRQVGIIELDIPKGIVHPLEVNLENGSFWKGLSSMIKLGMHHILEGKDHLLFIIVLLLPSMLISSGNTWKGPGGTQYALKNLLQIVTAFTIGHSVTLLIGANQWVSIPQQPVEFLIAVSILISAIHAIWPIFPGKETLIASGFGLVHGLAFATVLTKMKMSTSMLLWSVFGFNVGIEIMQLFIISLVIPIFLFLARTSHYGLIRTTIAIASALMAIIWMMDYV
jgi:hypothetical protein